MANLRQLEPVKLNSRHICPTPLVEALEILRHVGGYGQVARDIDNDGDDAGRGRPTTDAALRQLSKHTYKVQIVSAVLFQLELGLLTVPLEVPRSESISLDPMHYLSLQYNDGTQLVASSLSKSCEIREIVQLVESFRKVPSTRKDPLAPDGVGSKRIV